MKPRANKQNIVDRSQVTVDPTLKRRVNDPFIMRKVEEARRVLGPYLKELADKPK